MRGIFCGLPNGKTDKGYFVPLLSNKFVRFRKVQTKLQTESLQQASSFVETERLRTKLFYFIKRLFRDVLRRGIYANICSFPARLLTVLTHLFLTLFGLCSEFVRSVSFTSKRLSERDRVARFGAFGTKFYESGAFQKWLVHGFLSLVPSPNLVLSGAFERLIK